VSPAAAGKACGGNAAADSLSGALCTGTAQVSHHPPIGAAHAENDNWTYDIVSAPSTKFLGNSVEIYPVGAARSPPLTAPLERV
jgi:Oxysterol-binding protein